MTVPLLRSSKGGFRSVSVSRDTDVWLTVLVCQSTYNDVVRCIEADTNIDV